MCVCKIDLIANWMSLHEGSLVFIGKFSEAGLTEFNKIEAPGGRAALLKYCIIS